MTTHPRAVVAGFGSRDRHDDGVGPLVADALAPVDGVHVVGPLSDPLDLLGHWNQADVAIVVDATDSGSAPGTVRIIELLANDDAATDLEDVGASVTSTHGLGLAAVWRLSRAIGQGPSRVVIVGVEGECFDVGEGVSESVRDALPTAVNAVERLVSEVATCA